MVFQDILARAGSLGSLGCCLSWAVFNAGLDSWHGSTAVQMALNIGAGSAVHREASVKLKSLFPFSIGDLHGVRSRLVGMELDQVLAPEFVSQAQDECWLALSLACLNGISGNSRDFREGAWTKLQKQSVATVKAGISRLLSLDQTLVRTAGEVEKELASRFLTYTGEEVPRMQPLGFAQVEKALPPTQHGGSIDACKLVGSVTRSLLQNPQECVLPDDGRVLPKLQAKVHFVKGDRLRVANLLVSRNLCGWIPFEEVLTYRGQRVLNGMFAVGKGSFLPDGREIQRCIMNLIPSNSVLLKIEGLVNKLPNICQWLSTTIEDGEQLTFFQSDMSSAFYLFHLPPGWMQLLAFNILVDGSEIGMVAGRRYALACRVLPMGWSSAVGIMQELADRLTSIGRLPPGGKLERDKVLPPWMTGVLREASDKQSTWYHVYLDNFCGVEKIKKGSSPVHGQQLHDQIENAWLSEGVLSSAKKKISGATEVKELGAFVGGDANIIGADSLRLLKLVQLTLLVISRGRLRRKWVQVVAGRWVHILQFRRPGMVLIDQSWSFISGSQRGWKIENVVRRELLGCCLGIAMLHTYLGAKISSFTTCSDASGVGGAIAMSSELTEEGKSFVHTDTLHFDDALKVPIMVISLFNGIGGAFRAYDLCGVIPEVLISCEIHKPAIRVVSRRWPHAIAIGDIRSINKNLLRNWKGAYPLIRAVHIWGGFPCVDLSSVKAYRKNLAGTQSGLFFEMVRVIKDVRDVFGLCFDVRYICENVSSMDAAAADEITRVLGRKPYSINSLDAVPIQRPRFCWTNVDCWAPMEGVSLIEHDRWTTIAMTHEYPLHSQWIEEGWQTNEDEEYLVFPTCMKAIKREHPPPLPAGLNRCCQDDLLRWAADDYRFPPYHYQHRFLLTKGGRWRLLSASERELLHGFGFEHTAPCYSASDIKRDPQGYEDQRKSLIGDSFNMFSFAYFAAQACRQYLPSITYNMLWSRMGLAPGSCSPLSLESPLQRKFHFGCSGDGNWSVSHLHRSLLRRTNHTGSDVRISTGTVVNPRAYPRQSVVPSWWHWQPLFSYRWKRKDHINNLELRAIIHSIEYRINHKREADMRVFHLTDSYVCMAVISKGRSSSKMLSKLLKRLSALLLAFNILLVICHVESTDNPTDEMSRLGGTALSSGTPASA